MAVAKQTGRCGGSLAVSLIKLGSSSPFLSHTRCCLCPCLCFQAVHVSACHCPARFHQIKRNEMMHSEETQRLSKEKQSE